MAGWQEFTGLNRGYVLELYEKYRSDPASVDAETRAVFEQWTPPAETTAVHGRRRLREDRRRGPPGAIDPPLRPSCGEARSARVCACPPVIRRCCPKPTTSPKKISAACRRH